jgi:aquaglyceroporin related protein
LPSLLQIHRYVREFLAEMLGTFALVIFGDGAVAQVVLGNAARGDTFFGGFLNISFGYGLALMIGICISGGVSGGHLNPAVTLAMAAIKNLKMIQVQFLMPSSVQVDNCSCNLSEKAYYRIRH